MALHKRKNKMVHQRYSKIQKRIGGLISDVKSKSTQQHSMTRFIVLVQNLLHRKSPLQSQIPCEESQGNKTPAYKNFNIFILIFLLHPGEQIARYLYEKQVLNQVSIQISSQVSIQISIQVPVQVSIQVSIQVPSQFFLGNIDSWQPLPSLQSTRVQVDITYVARCTRNRPVSV